MLKRSEKLEAVRSWDKQNFMHPWESMAALGTGNRHFSENASGIRITIETGEELIDGPGGMWCVQLGYGNGELADAMALQAREMAYFSPFNASNSLSAKLAHELAKRTPGDLNRVFFTTGGSTAVDSAMRFVQFRNNVLGKPEKKIFISREKAYHGSTYLSASVSGKERDKNWFDHATDLVRLLPDVNPFRRPQGMSMAEFLDAKVADLENAILEAGPERVAAFIAEPVLASGGVIVPPEGYHQRCLEVCRRHDVLYISDEVVTCFGRLGHWFASEPVFGIVPDIITCAKGLTSGYSPMGACIISDRLVDEISGGSSKNATFSNGFTYSGHPVSAAVALKTIEIFERDGILDHVRSISPLFQERVRALSPLPMVVDTRGMGLVGCVECSTSENGRSNPLSVDLEVGARIDANCQKLGLLVRPIVNMCVFSPPLVITADEIDLMFDLLEKAIRLTADELAREGLLGRQAR